MTFFPIGDEIYRTPKYLGWTAEEYTLWMLAGSFSADRLTDGFVPRDALVFFPAAPPTTADLLVKRGIWRRVRGGYQYIDWPEHCTKAYVERKREIDRKRQQKRRKGDSNEP